MYISDAYKKVAELVHRGKSSLITTPTTTFLDQQAFGRTFIGPNATLPKGKEKKTKKKLFYARLDTREREISNLPSTQTVI